MQIKLDTPNDKQKLFLRDKHKYVGFGGARGGGKSWAVRFKAIVLSINKPGIKVMIVRKTYPELRENHIEPLIQMLNCYGEKSERIATYNDSKKTITFINGSRILFRYCDTEKDADRFQGTEVDILFLDEGTHFSETQYKKISACVRGANNFPHRVYITCNPGGIGHEWVKRLFIDRIYKGNEKAEDYNFIQSLVTDNKVLMKYDPDYINTLRALPPKLREAWLNGDWNIFQGAFFEEFRQEPDKVKADELGVTVEQLQQEGRYTHVIDDFEPPAWWTYYRAYDFGYGKPFACLYYAVDDNDVAYQIAEIYGCTDTPNEGVKLDPYKQFDLIRQFEQEHPYLKGKNIIGVADPSIWDGSRGESVAEVADKHGIYFEPGDNARIAGWLQVHYRLSFDNNGYSKLQIFRSCKETIRVIPLQMYDEHKPEDLDTSLEDHIPDAIRYFCMLRKIKPVKKVKSKDYKFDPLNQIKDLKYKRLS